MYDHRFDHMVAQLHNLVHTEAYLLYKKIFNKLSMMLVQTNIKRALYDWDGRKYIEFENIGRVKVPFRYGRIMCKILGDMTIQEMKEGMKVEVFIETKVWDCVEHNVLYSIQEIE